MNDATIFPNITRLNVKQFSLPQAQLDMIKANVCLVYIKLDFVTIFTNLCNANSNVIFLRKSAFPIGLASFCIRKKLPAFLLGDRRE